MGKKTYIHPLVKIYNIQLRNQLLTTSNITPNGSSNTLQFSNENANEDEEARVKANYVQWDGW